MIPLLLTLRNFMCYREKMPPLSFESFHIACLSGANGHGKSALLDAVTWALWGESRAKDDDELIHQGQIEMEVDFEFAVGEQRYRVIRKHAMAGPRRTRQASLELQAATPEGFKSITGDSRQQTQQKLLDLLRMDYQTFINSSFLIQGRANEFSLKQPAQRKEVLSSILGLSFYDKVGEGAREMARSRQGEGENLEKSIADIDVELGKRDEYESEFEKARVHVQRLEGEVQAREAELHKLRSERDSLEGGRVTLLETEKRLHNDSLELIRRQGQAKEHRSKIEAYEGLLQERKTVEKGYQQFLAARKSVDEWNERLQLYTSLREEVVVLEKEIARAREDVAAEVKISRSWFSQESAKSAQLPAFERQLAELKAQLEGLTHSEEVQRQKNLRMQELQSQFIGLRSESVRLGRETKAVQEKLALLLHGEARCPLCETELGVDGIGRLESKYRDELLSRSEAVKANLAEQQGLSGQQEKIAREIGQLEKLINRQVENKQRAVLIEKGIHEAGEASGRVAEWGKKLAGLERVLERKDYAHAQQTALRERELQLGELGYDNGKHGEAQKLLRKCEGYEAAYRALDEADKVLPQVRQSLGMAEEEVARLERELESDSVRVEVLKRDLSSLPQVEERLGVAAREHERLGRELAEERRGVGGLEEKLRRCVELLDSKKNKERLLQESREEEGIYRELSEAFGKKGIQALVIELALPEIEEEANRLLQLMSDNRFSLRIDTQRPTKSGKGMVETFDIKVADELGTRGYEMFSGGEAFRIDLALRLALSKVLARRAGAPMRTLVIDEGFGTQDDSGREKLVEAINSIQDEFDKIIVITHIEELKDAFPVRLDVVKTEEGSMVTVS